MRTWDGTDKHSLGLGYVFEFFLRIPPFVARSRRARTRGHVAEMEKCDKRRIRLPR